MKWVENTLPSIRTKHIKEELKQKADSFSRCSQWLRMLPRLWSLHSDFAEVWSGIDLFASCKNRKQLKYFLGEADSKSGDWGSFAQIPIRPAICILALSTSKKCDPEDKGRKSKSDSGSSALAKETMVPWSDRTATGITTAATSEIKHPFIKAHSSIQSLTVYIWSPVYWEGYISHARTVLQGDWNTTFLQENFSTKGLLHYLDYVLLVVSRTQ